MTESRHRPVPSLAQLSSRQVKKVIMTAVPQLNSSSPQCLRSSYLPSSTNLIRSNVIKTMQEYILCAPFIFQVKMYSQSRRIVLILSMAVARKQFKIRDKSFISSALNNLQ